MLAVLLQTRPFHLHCPSQGMQKLSDDGWSLFQRFSAAAGLNRAWVLSRNDVDSRLPGADGLDNAPARLRPGYRRLVLLGSPGRVFWDRFHDSLPPSARPPDPAGDPLDRYTEKVVEDLCARMSGFDPSILALYPFRHERRMLGFQRLLGNSNWTALAPFGVHLDPEAGPWIAWRAVVLTRLDWPLSTLPERSPCPTCPAPCVAACPAEAVRKDGFDWRNCAGFRLAGTTCRETCLARLACPVGGAHRYGGEQMRHHYRASMRELETMQPL